MDFAFDHLVWFTQNPRDAVFLTKDLGFHTVMGGSHGKWGTLNTLIHFGLPYIEFLGIENIRVAKEVQGNPLITQILNDLPNGEGPARIALRTHDIEAASAHLKKQGIQTVGPFPGSRLTPNGQLLKWSLLFLEGGDSDSLPFIIDWKVSDEDRKKELAKQNLDGRHYFGYPEFAQIGFVVRNLDETINTWQRLFGLESGERFESEPYHADCGILKLPGSNLYFYSPTEDGPAQKVLSTRSERPFLVGIQNTKQNRELELLGGTLQLS